MTPERQDYSPDYLEILWNSYTGIPKKFREEPFDVNLFPGGVTTKDQILGVDLSRTGLMLHGITGRGKTRIGLESLRMAHNAGFVCRFMDCQLFASEAVSAYRGGTERAFFREHLKPQILMLDDLGKAKITPRVGEALFELVNRRMDSRKTMVITTNETGKSLDARFEDKECVSALLRRLREICRMVAV